MITLSVGLEDIYPKSNSEWDEDACSDFVNQIGKKLERIGRMDDSQKINVLLGAHMGGFIRSHELMNLQGNSISSKYQLPRGNLFSLVIGFMDHDPGNSCMMEIQKLRKLIHDLGTDLERFRKLTRPQMAEVGYGLEWAGFVSYFRVSEVIQESPAILTENYFNDAIPTPPPLPPPHDASLPGYNVPSTCDKPESWIDDCIPLGDSEGNQVDWLQYPSGTPEKPYALRSLLDIASPGATSGPEGGVSCYPTPSTTCQSPDESMLLVADPRQAVPPYPGKASPAPVFSPGPNEGYPTPSTIQVEIPGMREQHAFQGLGATMVSHASDTNGQSSDLGMQATTTESVNNSNHGARDMLQSCSVSLENAQIQRILDAEARPLAQGLDSILQPLFDHRDKYGSLDLQALGLPVQWKGIQAAVSYLRVLDADATSHYLNPVAKRIGHVLLYFNYEELCKHPEKYCPTPSSKRPASHVLGCILDAYPDDPRINKPEKRRRDKISAFYVRRGKWWWILASNWGVGMLLAGDNSPHDVMCNDTFSDRQTKVLVTFVQKTRPGTIRVLKALEPVVKQLMFARITYDLREVIFDKDVGLLRPKEMASVREDDETALAFHGTENSWGVVDVKKAASQKLTEFLRNVL